MNVVIEKLLSNGFHLIESCKILMAIHPDTIILTEKMKAGTATGEEKKRYYTELCELIMKNLDKEDDRQHFCESCYKQLEDKRDDK